MVQIDYGLLRGSFRILWIALLAWEPFDRGGARAATAGPSGSIHRSSIEDETEPRTRSSEADESPLAPPVQRLTLEVGRTRQIVLDPDGGVVLSRRGIIDLHHRGQGVWEIIALRAGLVTLGRRGEGGESGSRYLVEVIPRLDEDSPSGSAPWPRWLCQGGGLQCDPEDLTIRGDTDHPERYRAARQWCQLREGCLAAVRLSPRGEAAMEVWLGQVLGPHIQVSRIGNGLWRLTTKCGKRSRHEIREDIDKVTDLGLRLGYLTLVCEEEAIPPSYTLDFMVLLADREEVSQEGGLAHASMTLDVFAQKEALSLDLLSQLSALGDWRHYRVLAQPRMLLRAGVPLDLQSGGEFAVPGSGSHKRRSGAATEWKTHGLSLKAQVTEGRPGEGILNFEAALRLRGTKNPGQLGLESLKSESVLPLGVQVLLGSVDFELEQTGKVSWPWLAKMPLIGPLFVRRSEALARTKALFLAKLTGLPDGAPVSPREPPQGQRREP